MQWFCQVARLEQVRVPSKSTLARYDKLLPAADVRELVDRLNRVAVEDAQRLELERALRLDVYLSDTTCIEANIHFPTDWVLLRDAVRTLLKAVKVIRQHGLKHRLPDPDQFLRQINRLSIEMGRSRRRPDSAKRRKTVLRHMKRLAKQAQGLIVDWKLHKESSPGDIALRQASLTRIQQVFGRYWPGCRKNRRWRMRRKGRHRKQPWMTIRQGDGVPTNARLSRVDGGCEQLFLNSNPHAHPRCGRRRPKSQSGSFGTSSTYASLSAPRNHPTVTL